MERRERSRSPSPEKNKPIEYIDKILNYVGVLDKEGNLKMNSQPIMKLSEKEIIDINEEIFRRHFDNKALAQIDKRISKGEAVDENILSLLIFDRPDYFVDYLSTKKIKKLPLKAILIYLNYLSLEDLPKFNVQSVLQDKIKLVYWIIKRNLNDQFILAKSRNSLINDLQKYLDLLHFLILYQYIYKKQDNLYMFLIRVYLIYV